MSALRALALVPWLVVVGLPLTPPEPTGDPAPAVDATGATDVTGALQEVIDETPDGGVVRLEPDGEYRLEGTLLIEDRHDLEIDGGGARLFATTTGGEHRAHLRVIGGSRLVVRGLHISGANPYAGLDDRAYQPDLVGQHGIRLEGVTDIELTDIRVTDTYGDFVYVGRRDDGQWSERVWLHDSVLERSGRQGVSVTAGRDVVIERNVINDVRRATIDLEPNGATWGAENIHVLENAIGPGRLLFVAAAGRGPVDQVVVARNRLRGHILNVIVEPPAGDRRTGFWVIDNTSDTAATRSPMRFTSVDGLVVSGNTQAVTREGEGAVAAVDTCGAAVADNDVRPGSLQVTGASRCGAPPTAHPPTAPVVAGPRRAGTTTTTEAPAPSIPPGTTEALAPTNPAGGDDIGLWVLAAGVTTAGLLVGAVAALSGRRTRQRAGRRTAPRSPTR
jgi:hypothetical protein